MLRFAGTESVSVEVSGSMDAAEAQALAGTALKVREESGRVPISVLLIDMKGLRWQGAAHPAFSYGEALWRVGVVLDGKPAWFAHTCDLDGTVIQVLGGVVVRYPVRAAKVRFVEGQRVLVTVKCPHGNLSLSAAARDEQPAPQPPLPVVTKQQGRMYRIPWEETPAPYRRGAEISVDDPGLAHMTLGHSVTWDPAGLIHRGRIHQCGVARRVR